VFCSSRASINEYCNSGFWVSIHIILGLIGNFEEVERWKANRKELPSIKPRPMDTPDLVELDIQPPDTLKTNCLEITADPPIASVPLDVLAYILNIVYQTSDNDKNKRPNSPIVFSHVSRFWRSVALDNPLWWSRIIVIAPWKLDEVETFLKRSKECSLVLRIFVNIDLTTTERLTDSLPLDNHENLRSLISPHIHRCRIFHLQGYFDKPTKFLVPYLLKTFRHIHMPYLEQFIVDGRLEFEHRTYERKLFSSAPLLRDLRIGVHGLTSYLLPLSTITKLHITMPWPTPYGISPAELNGIFNACTCLTELALYDDILDLDDFTLPPLFVFPSLLTLQLLAHMTIVTEFLIMISSAPKLRRLVLVPVTALDLIPVQHSTTNHKFPSLTSIVLSPAYDESWVAIHRASTWFPTITHLILTNVYPTEFRASFLETTTPLFPRLLDLALKDVDEALGRAINDFVIFRHSKKIPLQTVFVDEASVQHLSLYSHLWGETKVVGVDLIGPLGEDLTHVVKHRFVGQYY